MKKVLKVILIVILAIIALAATFVLFLFINGTCPYHGHIAEDTASSWMAELPDDTLLKEVAIPGSHDAGTYTVLWPGRTQSYSIGTQLSFGARYFDIRVNKTDKDYVIYHEIFNGVTFEEVLGDIKTFITAHPSEILILDFQHFRGGSQDHVYERLTEELEKNDLVLHNYTNQSDLDFISSLTVGEARGKCIVFYGETDEDFSDWVFLRNNDTCTMDNMCMDSYYLGDYHKNGYKTLVEKAHPVYFDLLATKQKEGKDGLFVLQSQLTDGALIFGPWSIERGMEKQMNEYINKLPDSPYFKGVNIIMRDFLTPEKCKDIINLNISKGYFD